MDSVMIGMIGINNDCPFYIPLGCSPDSDSDSVWTPDGDGFMEN